jgi:hypothetical protein
MKTDVWIDDALRNLTAMRKRMDLERSMSDDHRFWSCSIPLRWADIAWLDATITGLQDMKSAGPTK